MKLVVDHERWTHVAVDVAATKLHDAVHVLYVATLTGVVRKFTVLPRTHQTCLVEIIDPFPPSAPFLARHIKTMQFLKHQVPIFIFFKNLIKENILSTQFAYLIASKSKILDVRAF